MEMKYKIIVFILMQTFLIDVSINASAQLQKNVKSDTLISNCLSEINSDSIRSFIQELQDMGTRYYMANNRREVAFWIMNKFLSFGYSNAYIDSFQIDIYGPVMQYNVIATLNGITNPDIFYVIGGHYDNVSNQGSMLLAPGADDNASGVAATIEIARVLKKINYQSVTSIRFIAFSCEEAGRLGSTDYAKKARIENKDIRMMINCDMISNAPTLGQWTVNLVKYDNSACVTAIAKYIALNYTSLLVNETFNSNSASDSYSFYDYGFQTLFLQEFELSDYYHSNSDTIENCNMPYCAEITKLACGILLQQSIHPMVKNLQTAQKGNDIKVTWNKSKESNVIGYNIYKSLNPADGFLQINSTTLGLNDTIYIDPAPTPFIYYYYSVKNVDELLTEGEIYQFDSAMVLKMNQGILIVDDTQNELLSPLDSTVDDFYDSLLYLYHPHQYDAIVSGPISFLELGKYSTVIWHTDKSTIYSKFFLSKNEIKRYLMSGGNLLLTTDNFTYANDHVLRYSKKYYTGSLAYDYLQCDSMYKNNTSLFFKARSLSSGYPSMEIDTLKTPATNNHHLLLIESIYKCNDASYIYSYDTQYDSTSAQGNMKGLPIGYEYMGNDYKLIVLGFPLWYMYFDQAKTFMNYVMENVFNESIYVPEVNANIGSNVLFPCYPNPFSTTTTIRYYLSESDKVNLAIYDITGKLITELVNKSQSLGNNTVILNSEKLNNGVYFCTLKTNRSSETIKLVLIR